jgi:hypothetical protein
LESFAHYGIDLHDPVQLFVAFEELADNTAMVLTELDKYRDHFPVQRLGTVFALACDWVLRELWSVVPDEVRNKATTTVSDGPIDDHLASLNWRRMNPHLAGIRENYNRLRQLDDTFQADERDVEQLGATYRAGMSEAEAQLRSFVSLYLLIRVETVVAELLPGYAKSSGLDAELLKIILVSRFRIVLANIPPMVRKGLGLE